MTLSEKQAWPQLGEWSTWSLVHFAHSSSPDAAWQTSVSHTQWGLSVTFVRTIPAWARPQVWLLSQNNRKGTAVSWLCHYNMLRGSILFVEMNYPRAGGRALGSHRAAFASNLCFVKGLIWWCRMSCPACCAVPLCNYSHSLGAGASSSAQFNQPTNSPLLNLVMSLLAKLINIPSHPQLCLFPHLMTLRHVQVRPDCFTTGLFWKMFPHHCYRSTGEHLLYNKDCSNIDI